MTGLLSVITTLISTAASWTKDRADQTRQMLTGWPAGYLLIVWSYPFISGFVPPLAARTAAGFDNISAMPDWYVNGFLTITAAVFAVGGIKR